MLLQTALHFAAQNGDMGLVKLLAGNYKADVESKNHVSTVHTLFVCHHIVEKEVHTSINIGVKTFYNISIEFG